MNTHKLVDGFLGGKEIPLPNVPLKRHSASDPDIAFQVMDSTDI